MLAFINKHPVITLLIISSVASSLGPAATKYVELKYAK